MLSGRFAGSAGEWALELRADVGVEEGLGRVSGDLFREDGAGARAHAASFLSPPLAPEDPLDTAVAARRAPLHTDGRLRLTPRADGGVLAELALARRDGAPDDAWTLALDRVDTSLRAIEVQPFVVAGALPPDDPGLSAVMGLAAAGAAAPAVTFVSCLARAGIRATLLPPAPLAVEAAGADAAWSDAELLAALAGLAPAGPPAAGETWRLPLLVASRSERPQTLGVTFDTGATGVGRTSALFFDAIAAYDKVAGRPAAVAREYLFTAVHELGHLLRLPHAWEPLGGVGPPERGNRALTFMGYPFLYYLGFNRFYERFPFCFRDEERLHLRHAPWPDIWPAPGVPSGPPELALAAGPEAAAPHPRLRLELRAPSPRLRFAQAVHLEVKLENLSRRRVAVPADLLDPEGGALAVHAVRLDAAGGRRREPAALRPLVERDRARAGKTLGAAGGGARGPSPSRYRAIDLTYGLAGGRGAFPFAEPGRYEVTAEVALPDGRTVRAAPLALEVEPPSRAEEAAAADLLVREVGEALALGGDPEGRAMARLREVAERGVPAGLAPWAAARAGAAAAHGFKRRGREATPADPRAGRALLERALAHDAGGGAFPNPLRYVLLEAAARCDAAAGCPEDLARTLGRLDALVAGLPTRNHRLVATLRRRTRGIARSLRPIARGGDPPAVPATSLATSKEER